MKPPSLFAVPFVTQTLAQLATLRAGVMLYIEATPARATLAKVSITPLGVRQGTLCDPATGRWTGPTLDLATSPVVGLAGLLAARELALVDGHWRPLPVRNTP